MKHALLIYKMDREDSLLINPIAIPVDKEYTTYAEALESIKTKIENDVELQCYLMKSFDIKRYVEEEYNETNLSIQFTELKYTNRPCKPIFVFDVKDETGETLVPYELKLEPEFTVIFD